MFLNFVVSMKLNVQMIETYVMLASVNAKVAWETKAWAIGAETAPIKYKAVLSVLEEGQETEEPGEKKIGTHDGRNVGLVERKVSSVCR